jgi:hypothetical protein
MVKPLYNFNLYPALKFVHQFAFLIRAAKQPAAKGTLSFDCGEPAGLLCERFIRV